MKNDSTLTVTVTHRFNASPERVFDAFLDPDTAGKWLFATPSGQMVRVEIDARVGGKFIFTDRRDGEDVEHVGEYLEIDRPHRLAFTFAVPKFSLQYSQVTIDMIAVEGGAKLTLTHIGVLAEYASGTERGWQKILDALAATLA